MALYYRECGRRHNDGGGDEFEALIVTSWHVTAPTRTTRIIFASGAELVMDHHAVAGYLFDGGTVDTLFGSDGRIPRREAHYQALYQSYLVDDRPTMSSEASIHLHDLLLRPADGH